MHFSTAQQRRSHPTPPPPKPTHSNTPRQTGNLIQAQLMKFSCRPNNSSSLAESNHIVGLCMCMLCSVFVCVAWGWGWGWGVGWGGGGGLALHHCFTRCQHPHCRPKNRTRCLSSNRRREKEGRGGRLKGVESDTPPPKIPGTRML